MKQTIQEDVMNKKLITLTAMMMFATAGLSYSQSFSPALEKMSRIQLESMEKNYVADLSSDNKGLVESTLAIVTMVKLGMPENEFNLIRAKIEELKSLSATPSIRYMAFLAGAVFSDPAKFKQLVGLNHVDTNKFFSAINTGSGQTILSEK
jgi:hypothetical protein